MLEEKRKVIYEVEAFSICLFLFKVLITLIFFHYIWERIRVIKQPLTKIRKILRTSNKA